MLAKLCLADDERACDGIIDSPEGAWVQTLRQQCGENESVPACRVIVARELEGDVGWSDRRAGILWLALGTPLIIATMAYPACV